MLVNEHTFKMNYVTITVYENSKECNERIIVKLYTEYFIGSHNLFQRYHYLIMTTVGISLAYGNSE